jgi:acyl-coenzyme A synthetase/AMP-(fatty) acid ligase
VGKGDMVIICTPNLIESLIMMFATARIGASHFVVRDYFRYIYLAGDITSLKPKLLFVSTTPIKDGDISY